MISLDECVGEDLTRIFTEELIRNGPCWRM